MFRFGARAAPQAAFACGARSAMYMGQVYSRRHFARTNSPLLAGFIDPAKILTLGNGAAASGLALTTPSSLAVPSDSSLFALEEMTTLCVGGGIAGEAVLPELMHVSLTCRNTLTFGYMGLAPFTHAAPAV
jgi:hypothetical protein